MGIEQRIGKSRINILGPCSARERGQVVDVAEALLKEGVHIERACLWKPRTRPGGFEGVGVAGIPWLAEVTNMGITIATEVMEPGHVTDLMQGLQSNGGDQRNAIMWFGSRKQDHRVQRAIAKRMLEETPNEVKLLIKNQPWFSKEHWEGIVEHVIAAGFPNDRIILCHRGFAPGKNEPNPQGFRNLPDFQTAIEVKNATNLPMIIDASHIGGTREKVLAVLSQAPHWAFDGVMIEVDSEPEKALTDKSQQLSIADIQTILRLSDPRNEYV